MKGESVLHCSPYDKLILAWSDCRYKVLQPPEKLFVGDNLAHIAPYDRDRRMTLIYSLDHFAYVKHFTYGGVIMDKEYRCAPEGAKAALLTDQPTPEVYVKYAPAKGPENPSAGVSPGPR